MIRAACVLTLGSSGPVSLTDCRHHPCRRRTVLAGRRCTGPRVRCIQPYCCKLKMRCSLVCIAFCTRTHRSLITSCQHVIICNYASKLATSDLYTIIKLLKPKIIATFNEYNIVSLHLNYMYLGPRKIFVKSLSGTAFENAERSGVR